MEKSMERKDSKRNKKQTTRSKQQNEDEDSGEGEMGKKRI